MEDALIPPPLLAGMVYLTLHKNINDIRLPIHFQ
jgi:hypothetical protein